MAADFDTNAGSTDSSERCKLSTAREVSELRTVILMRGLPSCGKTTTANQLAGENGLVCEFDEYFYTQVGDDPNKYDWNDKLLPKARKWNLDRFSQAVNAHINPIIVDDCNCRPTRFAKQHVIIALAGGYNVIFREPTSPWWTKIRSLLADKKANHPALVEWAKKLTAMSKGTHRVPLSTFIRRIEQWQNVMTIPDILLADKPATVRETMTAENPSLTAVRE